MVLSNEPGIYRTGKYGIRTENMMVCLEKETTEFGRFLGFETLTLCPVDLDLVIPDMLTPGERSWLNSYHASVREKLTPLLPPYLAAFLGELTAEI
jgi:Xaa-Pro aminopeptidase